MRRFLHRWFCFWHLVYDSGAWRYCECEVCGQRSAFKKGGYQPVDQQWVDGARRGPCGVTERVPERWKRYRGCDGYNVPSGDYFPPRPDPTKAPPRVISVTTSTTSRPECPYKTEQIKAEKAATNERIARGEVWRGEAAREKLTEIRAEIAETK